MTVVSLYALPSRPLVFARRWDSIEDWKKDKDGLEEALANRKFQRPKGKEKYGEKWDYRHGGWISASDMLAAPSKYGYTPEQAFKATQK